MPQNQSKIDDKNFHKQMERLERERIKLANRLNELCQQEKDIQSSNHNNGQDNALKDIRDKIIKVEQAYVEKIRQLMHLALCV